MAYINSKSRDLNQWTNSAIPLLGPNHDMKPLRSIDSTNYRPRQHKTVVSSLPHGPPFPSHPADGVDELTLQVHRLIGSSDPMLHGSCRDQSITEALINIE